MVFAVERSIGFMPALIVVGVVVAVHTWGEVIGQRRARSRRNLLVRSRGGEVEGEDREQ